MTKKDIKDMSLEEMVNMAPPAGYFLQFITKYDKLINSMTDEDQSNFIFDLEQLVKNVMNATADGFIVAINKSSNSEVEDDKSGK